MSIALDYSPYYRSRPRFTSRQASPRWRGLHVGRKQNTSLAVARTYRSTKALSLKSLTWMGAALGEGGKAIGQLKDAVKVKNGPKRHYELSASVVMVGLGLLAAMLSFVYLAHFHQVATKGYELKRLEADRQQLMNQYEIKNLKLTEATSMHTIAASDRVSGMRRPGDKEFLRANTALANL